MAVYEYSLLTLKLYDFSSSGVGTLPPANAAGGAANGDKAAIRPMATAAILPLFWMLLNLAILSSRFE